MEHKLKGIQSPKFWDYIAVNAHNDIEAGGWYSSFGGKSFSIREMQQYKDNTIEKLRPYLSAEKEVIEIGCASGLTMFSIAPYVKKYIGTDMAKKNLLRNAERIKNDSIVNIELKQCSADQILESVGINADIIMGQSFFLWDK